jgi:chromate reductase, NAD(P)H dehydrogenase (quinone)
MADKIEVLGFAGSLREKSYNRALLRAAEEGLPEGMKLEIFDLSNIPFYNADVEAVGFPEPVQRFRERIAAADALLIATPEYNWSAPGVLKNAIDWASRPPNVPLSGKPAALMGASTGFYGTTRAQLHLRQILVYTNTPVLPQPQVLIARAEEKFDENGRLIDEASRELVRTLLEGLADWARRLRR